METNAPELFAVASKVFDCSFFRRELALAYKRGMPRMKSIVTVANDGLPPVVVRLPMTRKTNHISENTMQYVATKITYFLSRCSAELSTVITVITPRDLSSPRWQAVSRPQEVQEG